MAKPLLTDALWKRIEPLLPPHKPRRRRFPGRKPIDDRKALTGILFVLKTGINWEDRLRKWVITAQRSDFFIRRRNCSGFGVGDPHRRTHSTGGVDCREDYRLTTGCASDRNRAHPCRNRSRPT